MPIEGLFFGDLSVMQAVNVSEAVTSLEVSYTMDAVSQLTIELEDLDLSLFRANTFQVRRDVRYGDDLFEIAAVEIGPGSGSGAKVTVEARRKQIQMMKRDKKPDAYGGISATDYARIVAERYRLAFVGEPTATKRTILQAQTDQEDESVWDVLQRLAGEAGFVVFEFGGILIFGSQQWLLNRFGNNVAFEYGGPETNYYQVLELPTMRRSDDDPYAASGNVILDRKRARDLRPGVTATLINMGEFDGQYLITEVVWKDGEPDPVGVAIRKPTFTQ